MSSVHDARRTPAHRALNLKRGRARRGSGAAADGPSSSSTFTIAEPGKSSTVSLVIHHCSSQSRSAADKRCAMTARRLCHFSVCARSSRRLLACHRGRRCRPVFRRAGTAPARFFSPGAIWAGMPATGHRLLRMLHPGIGAGDRKERAEIAGMARTLLRDGARPWGGSSP